MTSAEQLFKDYNDYRFHTHNIQQLRSSGRYIRTLKRTPERLRLFEDLHRWCVSKGVDSRRWLHSLFESRQWLFAPKLEHLKSENLLQRYHGSHFPRLEFQRHTEHTQQLRREGKLFDRNRDLSASAELLKRHYITIGNPERCIDKMRTETFGYHPKSTACQSCPLQQRCAEVLQSACGIYPIIAVREGKVSVEEAQQVSRVRA